MDATPRMFGSSVTMETDDVELVDRSLAGDREAFGDLVERYQARFRAMVARYVASNDDAADIVQDAFIEAWRALAGFDRSRPVGPWLRSICRHRMIKHLRERSRLPSSPLSALDQRMAELAEQGAETSDDADQRLAALRNCLKRLSSDQREVLIARFQDGCAVQKIAAKSGRAPNSVSMLLLRLKDALMRCVGERLASGRAS